MAAPFYNLATFKSRGNLILLTKEEGAWTLRILQIGLRTC